VLKNLTFKVDPGMKVGVVGRTGAGKSTICISLSRIVELFEGHIDIDGIDISKVDL
jgi:ABC-type multidrug transport system fused ATPase/permease subunit